MVRTKGTHRMLAANSSRDPVYEMRTMRTGAERAEATAFAEDTALHLAQQAVDLPVGQFADPIRSQATVLGLHEDSVLVGCLVVHPEADLRHWGRDGRGRGLLVSVIPPVPGCSEQAGRLLTLWLADYAARNGLEWVWWELMATSHGEMGATLLDAVRDLGWEDLPAMRRADGEQVVRLRLRAAIRDALTAVISAPDIPPTPLVSPP
ncbi:hypothetical protein ABZX38_25610 [Streptomyces longwoodensis]|uniref:hypothetical protein n=1 Tax=Streptomyces longwoodensis TaxID=68231 RepID=UPI0033B4C980